MMASRESLLLMVDVMSVLYEPQPAFQAAGISGPRVVSQPCHPSSMLIRVLPWPLSVAYELWPARERICAFCRFCTSSDSTRTFNNNPLFSIR